MPADGTEPISDDELLFRRVPEVWHSQEAGVSLEAFRPNRDRDQTGLSVSRAKYESIEQAARSSRPGKSYYVAVFRAGDLRQIGIDVSPKPEANRPGHSEFPALNAANRNDPMTLERMARMKELCLRVEGPFPSDPPPSAK
jgi:hypothetical protein